VLDAFSRKIVGWAMAADLRTQLVLDALDMAIGQRRPREVIHHSDQAPNTPQSPSGYGARRPRSAHPWAPSATLTPCARASSPPTKAEARMAIFIFIEGWYHPGWRHSALGYQSTVQF